MRSLRVWLLLVLIVLVPLRGSLAATMPCDEGDGTPAAAMSAHAASHLERTALHEHSHASMAHRHPHPLGAADKCSLCAGLASPACPVDAVSPLPVLPARASLVVPPTVWPASFVPAKLERPPRTL